MAWELCTEQAEFKRFPLQKSKKMAIEHTVLVAKWGVSIFLSATTTKVSQIQSYCDPFESLSGHAPWPLQQQLYSKREDQQIVPTTMWKDAVLTLVYTKPH